MNLPEIKSPVAIFWFRRDLRLNDNAGLFHALNSGLPVLPIFIFDTNILDSLTNRYDARVNFIHDTLQNIQEKLKNEFGSTLLILHGDPVNIYSELITKINIKAVYTNHDYEPYAIERDETIAKNISEMGITFHSYKDQCIFEKDEIISDTGNPYRVYTPYKNKWLKTLQEKPVKQFPSEKYPDNFFKNTPFPFPTLEELGFKKSSIILPSSIVTQKTIRLYDQQRDYPFIEEGTSHLGVHFRFGTISIREKLLKALPLNAVWVSELIWRDFFMQLLWHYPHVITEAFNKKFNKVKWRTDKEDFEKWCEGKTGYPLVDAGMRELNATGYMHNRVRMVTASFLTKHLLISWQWGEAYFAEKLLDYDLSANNGNWQWSAGTGADAQPYFRIFNPENQMEKFDPEKKYIRKWVPEYGTSAYPAPMIDHKAAVERCKKAFLVVKE